jgi:hypothetical protein
MCLPSVVKRERWLPAAASDILISSIRLPPARRDVRVRPPPHLDRVGIAPRLARSRIQRVLGLDHVYQYSFRVWRDARREV